MLPFFWYSAESVWPAGTSTTAETKASGVTSLEVVLSKDALNPNRVEAESSKNAWPVPDPSHLN